MLHRATDASLELTLVKAFRSPHNTDNGHDPAGCPTRQKAGFGGEMLEGVVQIVCLHCDRDNRLPRDWLRNAPPCVACRNALFEGRPMPLDDERRFDKHVRHNDIPILARFHTIWSGESRVLQSVFDHAAAALEPRARLVSIDGAALSDLTERLKVVRYPTLLLLYRERELARATGAMNLAQLLAWARPFITTVVTGPA